MEEKMELEILVCCYSRKADVLISFGATVGGANGAVDTSDSDWIYEGVSDSFWENHYEFEPGIAKAEAARMSDPSLTYHQALWAVFGSFSLTYEVNGEKIVLDFEGDIDELMYSLLEA